MSFTKASVGARETALMKVTIRLSCQHDFPVESLRNLSSLRSEDAVSQGWGVWGPLNVVGFLLPASLTISHVGWD